MLNKQMIKNAMMTVKEFDASNRRTQFQNSSEPSPRVRNCLEFVKLEQVAERLENVKKLTVVPLPFYTMRSRRKRER
jgi:hypothetical protein